MNSSSHWRWVCTLSDHMFAVFFILALGISAEMTLIGLVKMTTMKRRAAAIQQWKKYKFSLLLLKCISRWDIFWREQKSVGERRAALDKLRIYFSCLSLFLPKKEKSSTERWNVGRSRFHFSSNFFQFQHDVKTDLKSIKDGISCAMKLIFMISLKFVIACCPCCCRRAAHNSTIQTTSKWKKYENCSLVLLTLFLSFSLLLFALSPC